MNAIIERIRQEEEAKTKVCGCFRGKSPEHPEGSCTNMTTHTEGGHPVCNECAMPKYKNPRSIPVIIGFSKEKNDE